jgi:hypothetical protein
VTRWANANDTAEQPSRTDKDSEIIPDFMVASDAHRDELL